MTRLQISSHPVREAACTAAAGAPPTGIIPVIVSYLSCSVHSFHESEEGVLILSAHLTPGNENACSVQKFKARISSFFLKQNENMPSFFFSFDACGDVSDNQSEAFSYLFVSLREHAVVGRESV